MSLEDHENANYIDFSMVHTKLSFYPISPTGPPNLDKTFMCDKCGNAFKKKGELKSHTLTHLSINDRPRPFTCDICDKKYSTDEKFSLFTINIHLSFSKWETKYGILDSLMQNQIYCLPGLNINQQLGRICSYTMAWKTSIVINVILEHIQGTDWLIIREFMGKNDTNANFVWRNSERLKRYEYVLHHFRRGLYPNNCGDILYWSWFVVVVVLVFLSIRYIGVFIRAKSHTRALCVIIVRFAHQIWTNIWCKCIKCDILNNGSKLWSSFLHCWSISCSEMLETINKLVDEFCTKNLRKISWKLSL